MDNKKLLFTVRNEGAKTFCYPACEMSKLFCQIAGTKTISEDVSYTLEQNGYSFTIITD